MFTTSHFLWMGITVLVILITSFEQKDLCMIKQLKKQK